MGSWRFRRSVKVAPAVRLNFNKKSISVTGGVRGAHATVNSRGQRTLSAGIPGTGLSYRDTRPLRSGRTQEPNDQRPSTATDAAEPIGWDQARLAAQDADAQTAEARRGLEPTEAVRWKFGITKFGFLLMMWTVLSLAVVSFMVWLVATGWAFHNALHVFAFGALGGVGLGVLLRAGAGVLLWRMGDR